MRSPKQQTSDRQADAARPPSGGVEGERVFEQKGVVTSMVDALEDILKWERASERALRVAAEVSPTDQDVSTN